VLAGGFLLLSLPPYGLWWLAPVGVALLDLATGGIVVGGTATGGVRRVRAGVGLGALCGATLFLPLLSWTQLHELGTVPWLLLSGLETAYLAALGGAAVFVAPLGRRWPAAAPALTAVLWVAQEALRDRTPFGGFPWGRLAFSQGDSPLLRLASLGGAPLVTFAVALAGGLLAAAVRARRWRPAAAAGAGVLVLMFAAAAVPVPRPDGPRVRVAFVQGNVPRLGLDFNAQRRAVLDNHVQATLDLARQVAAGAPRPDLVVWPENSSDIDPLVNDDARASISAAAAAIGAPILVGAVLEGPPGHVRNASLVWPPGRAEPADIYVKRHPVPFAEYIPLRRLARAVSPAVDRVPTDFLPGDRVGVLRVGPVDVGVGICFEVAYDDVIRDTVTGGAQLLVVQTNNATFNRAEAAQQLAMVRLRAVEHGRASLMVSTVGISGFVGTDGSVSDATVFDTRSVHVRELSVGAARTLGSRLGAGPEYLGVLFALAALVIAVLVRVRAAPTVVHRVKGEV
jgi:apolipoprotein N-acyltransferase